VSRSFMLPPENYSLRQFTMSAVGLVVAAAAVV